MACSRDDFEGWFPRESEYVERKGGIGGRPIQEAVTAFSNADGGIVLIGVDDAGRINGKELTQAAAEAIHQAIHEVHCPGRYDVHPLTVGGIDVIVIAVHRRTEGFAQTSNGRVVVRRGPRNVALIGHELLEFVASRSRHRFETQDAEVPLAEASPDLVSYLAKALGWGAPATWADRLFEHSLASAEEEPTLTVTGALLLLDDPQVVIRKAFIEVLRYPKADKDYDRRVTIGGPAFQQVAKATELVMNELGSELVVLGLHRHELPRLPPVAVREAIANAVAHRSYELSNSAIRIELRPEAVTITSPGGLPEPVTVKNIRETNAARNPDLIRVLRKLGLAEDIGRGIDEIQDSMMAELLDPPEFEESGHSVKVTLPLGGTVGGRERAWVRELEGRGHLNPTDRKLLVQAARGDALTNAKARKLLNVDSVVARQALKRLRDNGLLVQTGAKGGASYHLAEGLQPPLGMRLRPAELEELVVELAAAEGRVTNQMVREHTGLDRVDASRLLKVLTSTGRLVRAGDRRGSHYRLPEQVRMDLR